MNRADVRSEIRRMRREDLPFVLDLINAEGWDYDLVDVERILEIDPEDSVTAVSGGEVIGAITVACHDGRGVLGHVVVKNGWRRKGIGREMLVKVIKQLESKRISIIELYSVPNAVEFYRRLNFHKIGDLMIFVGSIRSYIAIGPSKTRIGEISSQDLGSVIDLDRRITGFERGKIIEHLMIPHLDHSVGLFDGERLIGFALGRQSGNSGEIGPWIMEKPDWNDAAILFTAAMDRLGNRKAYVEVPGENALAHKIVLESGLMPQYPAQRFVRTKLEVRPFGPGVMSYSGLEYG